MEKQSGKYFKFKFMYYLEIQMCPVIIKPAPLNPTSPMAERFSDFFFG